MTAMNRSSNQASGSKAVALIGIVFAVAMMLWAMRRIPPMNREVALPTLSAHALLHSDAKAAWDCVRHKGRFCKWDCRDGRTRYLCPMEERGVWAIVVTEGANRLVTAFTGDQDYVNGVADNGCHNPWKMAHP